MPIRSAEGSLTLLAVLKYVRADRKGFVMLHFKVKDYEKFQHYKDRSPPWIKLYNSTLEDYTFATLEDKDKAHLVAIWLLASRYENKLPYDKIFIAGKINARSPVDLDLLCEKGFIIKIKGINKGAGDLLANLEESARPEREREAETESKHIPISELDFSKFTDEQKEYFKKKAPDVDISDLIDTMKNWCAAKGKRYENYYRALQDWAKREQARINLNKKRESKYENNRGSNKGNGTSGGFRRKSTSEQIADGIAELVSEYKE